ncbi:MAG: hypothetical protein ACLTCI_01255 [[Clostridium] nexile]
MKQKWNEKYMYYGIMLFVVTIFLVIMLPERKKEKQNLILSQASEDTTRGGTIKGTATGADDSSSDQNEWISRNCTCRNKISGRRGTIATAGDERRSMVKARCLLSHLMMRCFKGTIKVESPA